MTHSSRKRVRSMEDESSEFTPLSKRINNLHLNGFTGIHESVNTSEQEWKNRNYTSSSNDSEPSTSSSSGKHPAQNNFANDYRPDLNANDNPYYYENNKLLYTLYMERMHRHSNLNNL